MSYQTLGIIADIYSPLLVIASLTLATRSILKAPDKRLALQRECFVLLAGLVWVYGWMWLDGRLGLWPALSMDYSTHTAFACVFVAYLWLRSKPLWRLLWPASLLSYFLLMVYQQYHSTADIVTTALFSFAGFTLIWRRAELRQHDL